MVRSSLPRRKGRKVQSWCTKDCKQSVPRGISGITIAKTNFLELEIALCMRVGSTKDFGPYADDASWGW